MIARIGNKGGCAMKARFFGSRFILLLAAVVSMSLLSFSSVWGADYPVKPISVIVSATAGGPLDVNARILAEAGSKDLGVPVVVVNKAGPGGALAASFVGNEKPDGYTLLFTNSSTMTANFAVFPSLSYKRTDFVPVLMAFLTPINIAVKADSPYKSLKEFLDAAKKNPGKLRSGTFSPSISLVWEGLFKGEGIDIIHMQYKGAADAFVAIMGGHIDCYLDALTPMIPQLEAGKIRLLASISSKRNKNYPDVPTLKDLGYGIFSRDFWSGFFAPAGLPQPIMDKVVPVFEKALSLPNVQAQMEKAGVIPHFMGPREYAQFIDEEYKFYMDLAKQKRK